MDAAFLVQPYQACLRFYRPTHLYSFHSHFPTFYAMVHPSHVAIRREKGPGRPPNAWILYRKTKLATLTPVPPGHPRRSQAEVSKIISKLWREESDEVKAEFERRAEVEKARHLRQYPGYKYNPESKAEKERRKKAKAAEKELARVNSKRGGRAQVTPYLVPFVAAAPSAHSQAPVPNPAAWYGDDGPSPPMSRASSPISSTSAQMPPPLRSQSFPVHPSPNSSPTSDSFQSQQKREVRPSSAPHTYSIPMPPPPACQPAIIHPSLPHPSQFHPQVQQQTQPPLGFTGEFISWNQSAPADQMALQEVVASLVSCLTRML